LSTFNVQPPPFPTSHKSFICNIYEPPRKCCKQKTYAQPKPFRCNIYAKPGGGGRVIGRRFGRADANAKRKKEKEQKERADRSPPLQRGKRWLTLTTTRP